MEGRALIILRSVVRFHLAPQLGVQPFCSGYQRFWSRIACGRPTLSDRYDPVLAVSARSIMHTVMHVAALHTDGWVHR